MDLYLSAWSYLLLEFHHSHSKHLFRCFIPWNFLLTKEAPLDWQVCEGAQK